jgi:CRP-like cAMP-binding protein
MSRRRYPASGNHLINRLRREDPKVLAALEMVPLQHGQELFRQNRPLSHVYFPTSGMCSALVMMGDGRMVEAATVGREGMVGIAACLGTDLSAYSAIAQVAGDALRVPVAAFQKELQQSPVLDRLARLYVAYALHYANQTLACNALHSVEQRACRWLLMTQYRVGKEKFLLTHELLAEMLGCTRQTVSIVAGTLQRAGLIIYTRGVVTVLRKEGLEEAACECFKTTLDMYEQIMR